MTDAHTAGEHQADAHHVNYMRIFIALCVCTLLSVIFDMVPLSKGIITVLVFAVCVFLALSASIIAMRSTVDSLAEAVLPHADQVVDATVQTMHDVGGSMMNMRKITQMTSEFAAKDLGPNGAAGKTLNATSIVAERLARLLEHPTIQLSLGG